jgi:glycine betaine/proline transport system substrate-binding protein
MRSKTLIVFGLIIIVFGLLAAARYGTQTADKNITIALTPNSYPFLPAYIVKIIIEDNLGYKVRLQKADVGPTYSGLASGDIDIFLDSRLPDLHKDYMDQYGDKIDDLGVIYAEGLLGWVSPTYVEPDSIAELNEYKDKFDSDGNGKGELVGIEAGAGMMQTSQAIIDGYGLDFEVVESSEWAMMAEAQKAIKENRWIVFLGWSPHWMFAQHDLKYLEDPQGFWRSSEVHRLVTKGLDKRAPEVMEFIRYFTMDIDDLNQIIYEIEVEKRDPDAVARGWIEDNPVKVKALLGK